VAPPTGTGSTPQSVAFSPSGGLLAVANSGSNNVSMFAVGSNGTLGPLGPATATNAGTTVSSNGAQASVPGSPFVPVGALNQPSSAPTESC